MCTTLTETNSWSITKMERKKKLYHVMESKKDIGKSYKSNASFSVVTYDVESAIRLVKEVSPDLEISQVNLKDSIDMIDPEIILDIFNNKENT